MPNLGRNSKSTGRSSRRSARNTEEPNRYFYTKEENHNYYPKSNNSISGRSAPKPRGLRKPRLLRNMTRAASAGNIRGQVRKAITRKPARPSNIAPVREGFGTPKASTSTAEIHPATRSVSAAPTPKSQPLFKRRKGRGNQSTRGSTGNVRLRNKDFYKIFRSPSLEKQISDLRSALSSFFNDPEKQKMAPELLESVKSVIRRRVNTLFIGAIRTKYKKLSSFVEQFLKDTNRAEDRGILAVFNDTNRSIDLNNILDNVDIRNEIQRSYYQKGHIDDALNILDFKKDLLSSDLKPRVEKLQKLLSIFEDVLDVIKGNKILDVGMYDEDKQLLDEFLLVNQHQLSNLKLLINQKLANINRFFDEERSWKSQTNWYQTLSLVQAQECAIRVRNLRLAEVNINEGIQGLLFVSIDRDDFTKILARYISCFREISRVDPDQNGVFVNHVGVERYLIRDESRKRVINSFNRVLANNTELKKDLLEEFELMLVHRDANNKKLQGNREQYLNLPNSSEATVINVAPRESETLQRNKVQATVLNSLLNAVALGGNETDVQASQEQDANADEIFSVGFDALEAVEEQSTVVNAIENASEDVVSNAGEGANFPLHNLIRDVSSNVEHAVLEEQVNDVEEEIIPDPEYDSQESGEFYDDSSVYNGSNFDDSVDVAREVENLDVNQEQSDVSDGENDGEEQVDAVEVGADDSVDATREVENLDVNQEQSDVSDGENDGEEQVDAVEVGADDSVDVAREVENLDVNQEQSAVSDGENDGEEQVDAVEVEEKDVDLGVNQEQATVVANARENAVEVGSDDSVYAEEQDLDDVFGVVEEQAVVDARENVFEEQVDAVEVGSDDEIEEQDVDLGVSQEQATVVANDRENAGEFFNPPSALTNIPSDSVDLTSIHSMGPPLPDSRVNPRNFSQDLRVNYRDKIDEMINDKKIVAKIESSGLNGGHDTLVFSRDENTGLKSIGFVDVNYEDFANRLGLDDEMIRFDPEYYDALSQHFGSANKIVDAYFYYEQFDRISNDVVNPPGKIKLDLIPSVKPELHYCNAQNSVFDRYNKSLKVRKMITDPNQEISSVFSFNIPGIDLSMQFVSRAYGASEFKVLLNNEELQRGDAGSSQYFALVDSMQIDFDVVSLENGQFVTRNALKERGQRSDDFSVNLTSAMNNSNQELSDIPTSSFDPRTSKNIIDINGLGHFNQDHSPDFQRF